MVFPHKHHNLDLPVYESEQYVAWTNDELISEGILGPSLKQTSFVRGIKLQYLGNDDLNGILRLADRLIPEAAEAIGATALKPEWGLHKMPKPGSQFFGKELEHNEYTHTDSEPIPDGYALVARVPYVLHPKQPDINTLLAIEQHANDYYRNKVKNQEPALRDLRMGQTVIGTLEDNAPVEHYLVDIDLRIALSPLQIVLAHPYGKG